MAKHGQKSVQSLLAPRKDLTKKDKDKDKNSEKAPKVPKRTLSDVEKSDHSMDLSMDFTEITKDLQEIKCVLKDSISKKDLTKALKDVVKQSDIETIVTNIVSNLLSSFKDEIRKEIDEQISGIIERQNQEITELKQKFEDNVTRLNKKLIDQYNDTQNLRRHLDEVNEKSYEALSMANYNEQYSRKFNFKMINYKNENDNDIKANFMKMVKEDLKLEIESNDVIAIHKLRANRGGVPPVIVKMKNSDVKTQIMRRKKQTKGKVRLFDDITRKNRDLIQHLKRHKDIQTAYYFNCCVYGITNDGLQIPFDICDDIQGKIDYEKERNAGKK